MFNFGYVRPASLDAAVEMLRADEEAKPLAGGQTLIPTLKQRLASPSRLVDLGRIPGLDAIRLDGGRLVVGAMARHADVATSPVVRAALPALAELASRIGDPSVRNRGTIGGSVANNDPSADYPAGCLGLGATLVTDRRAIAADDFFLGLFETALEPGEILARIEFPLPAGAAYEKFPHPASRYAMAGVFVAHGEAGVRVAVTGAGGNGVFRWAAAEAALAAKFSPAVLEDLALPAEDMIEDLHASGAYRAHLAGVLARRAVARIT